MKDEDVDEDDEMERSIQTKLKTLSTMQSSLQGEGKVGEIIVH